MIIHPPPCACTTVCLGSAYCLLAAFPLSWIPLRGLGSKPGCLWEDSIRTPPKPRARETCLSALPPQRSIWRLKPPQDASKTPPNRLLFGICFSMPFWIHFLSIFHLNLAPTWTQLRSSWAPMPPAQRFNALLGVLTCRLKLQCSYLILFAFTLM